MATVFWHLGVLAADLALKLPTAFTHELAEVLRVALISTIKRLVLMVSA
jgi:hypothetical protein